MSTSYYFGRRSKTSKATLARVVRTSDVLPKVVTSCDTRTSSTLPRGKSPTVQQMGEFCTLGVANGRSDRWKSACPSTSSSAGHPPSRQHSRPPGGQLFFSHGRLPTRPARRTEAAVSTGVRPCDRPAVRLGKIAVRPGRPLRASPQPSTGRLPSRPSGGRQPSSRQPSAGRPPGHPLRGRPPASSPSPAAPFLPSVDLFCQRCSQWSNFR